MSSAEMYIRYPASDVEWIKLDVDNSSAQFDGGERTKLTHFFQHGEK